jgi:hypothetical protein
MTAKVTSPTIALQWSPLSKGEGAIKNQSLLPWRSWREATDEVPSC